MTWHDPIVEEVRAAREAYAAQFDYDLKRMFEDLKSKEARSPARRARIQTSKLRSRLPAEPNVLTIVGKESKRKGTDRLTSQQIDRIIRKARATKKR